MARDVNELTLLNSRPDREAERSVSAMDYGRISPAGLERYEFYLHNRRPGRGGKSRTGIPRGLNFDSEGMNCEHPEIGNELWYSGPEDACPFALNALFLYSSIALGCFIRNGGHPVA
ncbi:hypothetical protein R1flu_004738 [Riccia fluitans]|uniref:Uncharacterized protein n=1 Tax=Riccia fluitans TaxID=41844 RepID=A0ABD1YR53_9MARC